MILLSENKYNFFIFYNKKIFYYNLYKIRTYN